MANIMRLGGGGGGDGLNIDYGLTPPTDTSKLWVPLTTKPANVEISGDSLQNAIDTVNKMVAAFPTCRANGASCAINGKVYIFGGQATAGTSASDSYSTTNKIYEYNPKTDVLVAKNAVLPTSFATPAAVAINGKAYIATYTTASSTYYGIYEYDPDTDTLTYKCALPTNFAVFNKAATVNGKMYLFDQHTPTAGSGTKYVVEYNPVTNTIVSKEGMPSYQVEQCHSVCAVNNKIYLFGGIYANTSYGYVQEYDPASDSFKTKTAQISSMVNAARYGSAVEINGKAYVFGGYSGSNLREIREYDPVADTITVKTATLLSDCNYAGNTSCVVDGTAYVFGGGYTSGVYRVSNYAVTAYTPKAYLGVNHLKVFASVYKSETHQLVTNIVNGKKEQIKLYMTSAFLGGNDGYAKAQEAYVYNESTKKWQSLDGTSMTTDMLNALAELGVT